MKHKSSDHAVNFKPKRIFANGENLLTGEIVTFQEFLPTTELIIVQTSAESSVVIALRMDKKNKEILENKPEVMGLPVPGLRYRVSFFLKILFSYSPFVPNYLCSFEEDRYKQNHKFQYF